MALTNKRRSSLCTSNKGTRRSKLTASNYRFAAKEEIEEREFEPRQPENPYRDWNTQNLIETIETLTDSDSFAQDKPEQKAVEQMAEVLSSRPIEQETDAGQRKRSCLNKVAASFNMVSYAKRAHIRYYPGHRNSKGEKAPWVELKDGRILDSYTSHEKALKGLRDHKYFKEHSASATQSGTYSPTDGDNGRILDGDHSIPETMDMQENHTGVDLYEGDSAMKFADANDPWSYPGNSDVLSGQRSVKEPVEGMVDNTGINYPKTETGEEAVEESDRLAKSSKRSAKAISADKASKLIEDLTEKLNTLYLSAKPILTVNETRQVREAVESIYYAMEALGVAQKIISKQIAASEEVEKQEKKESPKNVLKASLKLAKSEEELEDEKEYRRKVRKGEKERAEERAEYHKEKREKDHERKVEREDEKKERKEDKKERKASLTRPQFRAAVVQKSRLKDKKKAQIAAISILRTGAAYSRLKELGKTASVEQRAAVGTKLAGYKSMIASQAATLGMKAMFNPKGSVGNRVALKAADGSMLKVPMV